MQDVGSHDKIIARIQHFSEVLQQIKLEKESLMLVISESCEKEKLKDQVLVCEELLEHYYKIFDDILYR